LLQLCLINLRQKTKLKIQALMKKLIYILAIALLSSVTMTACTEEEIAPTHNTQGGNGSDPF